MDESLLVFISLVNNRQTLHVNIRNLLELPFDEREHKHVDYTRLTSPV